MMASYNSSVDFSLWFIHVQVKLLNIQLYNMAHEYTQLIVSKFIQCRQAPSHRYLQFRGERQREKKL